MHPIESQADIAAALPAHLVQFERFANCGHAVVPDAPEGTRSAFLKLGARRYMVISIAMTAALVRCDPAGRIVSTRLAVGSCSPVARRLPELEAAVTGSRPDAVVVDPAHLSALSPIDDLRGTAGYRAEVVAEHCARAIRMAAGHE